MTCYWLCYRKYFFRYAVHSVKVLQ